MRKDAKTAIATALAHLNSTTGKEKCVEFSIKEDVTKDIYFKYYHISVILFVKSKKGKVVLFKQSSSIRHFRDEKHRERIINELYYTMLLDIIKHGIISNYRFMRETTIEAGVDNKAILPII